jgi:hypothetical protein
MLGLWLPNLVLGVVGVIAFRRAARELPVLPALSMQRWRARLARLVPRAAEQPGA